MNRYGNPSNSQISPIARNGRGAGMDISFLPGTHKSVSGSRVNAAAPATSELRNERRFKMFLLQTFAGSHHQGNAKTGLDSKSDDFERRGGNLLHAFDRHPLHGSEGRLNQGVT